MTVTSNRWNQGVGGRWLLTVLALVALNVSVTFANVWPTLGLRLTGDVSLEVAVCVVGLLLARRWWGAPSGRALRWLAAFWVVLIVGRYVDVTARSLYGRDVNLYWDLRHVPDVGAMFATVATPWQMTAVGAGVVVVPLGLYVGARWAFGQLGAALDGRATRRALGLVGAVSLGLFVAQSAGVRVSDRLRFAEPVTPAYARELGELAYEMSGAGVAALGPAPPMRSDLAQVSGADVFLIFIESYGAVSWERPEVVDALRESRTQLDADIRDTARAVVSALVESPTFGGESWLAHISLLAGTEVRDNTTNVRLMAQDRDTLVKAFGRRGYHTVAIMPGLLLGWPEGAFYGFDDIYDHARLDYRGPPFGWWSINDQFALARVDSLEVEPRDRAPRFFFFPTISTHAPFTPAPPYQPDWARVLSARPYDDAELDRAWSEQPDWLNLAPSYVRALSYTYATVGGYLRLRADRDIVMILVGDHQPPALVTGEGASWNVPVHVIATRRGVLDRLRRQRFADGLAPAGPAIAQMDTLLPLLLDAFGDDDDPRDPVSRVGSSLP